MKQQYIEKCQKIAWSFIKSNYKKVEVIGWEIKYNYKCHLNSVQYAKEKWYEIYSCYYIEKWLNEPIAHFINYDPVTKQFIDNTLWWTVEWRDFFIVQKINLNDYSTIYNNLRELQDNMYNISCKNSFLNRIFNIKRLF